ncbi:hypothetical protein CLOM_g13917 [Closterium sp. NIES-68]|nr:hypothetical protein CLOM_g13917 [Closterium sp. NIES-68]GJP76790.1 hypothetical protein CLOP_g7250 [Closterium sp. NIES-67]
MADNKDGISVGKVAGVAAWAAVTGKLGLPSLLRVTELFAFNGEAVVNSDIILSLLALSTCPLSKVQSAIRFKDPKGTLIGAVTAAVLGLHNVVVRHARQKRLKEQSMLLPGEEAVWRRKNLPGNELMVVSYDEATTCYHNFFTFARNKFADNPCLGTRTADGFSWESYELTARRASDFGAGLVYLGLKAGDRFGIYSVNNAEWVLAELGGYCYGLVNVSLYATLGQEAVNHVVHHSEMVAVVCSVETLSSLFKALPSSPAVKTIIYMQGGGQAPTEEDRKAAEAADVQLLPFSQVEEWGAQNPQEHLPPKPEDLAVLMYTSGTTGDPKGVMLTHRNIIANTTSCPSVLGQSGVTLGPGDRYLSYLPLAHIFERAALATMYMQGVAVGFYSGKVEALVDDMAALKPTALFGVPRVFNKVHDKVLQQVEAGSPLKRFLFNTAIKESAKVLKAGGGLKALPFWDTLIFKKVQKRVGGRCQVILSGGAPISAATQQFLAIAFGCPALQGYGLSETSAAGTITALEDPNTGHVGPPQPSVDMKLAPVPEMEYLPTDKPRPRGEICFRGASVMVGYYKQEEMTAEVIDSDGWFHTGDIGQVNEDGTLTIIDRKKNIFKLAQGEYVAAEKLEVLYGGAAVVGQIFVYGDSFKSSLVAVVVPEKDVLSDWATSSGALSADEAAAASLADLCALPGAREHVLIELVKRAKATSMKGFEVVRGVALEAEAFSTDNDLMTPSFKLKRPKLKAKYQAVIDELYTTLT